VSQDPTLEIFFEEADELLRDFEEGMLRLERSGGDAETLNRVFRSAHTLKGNSGMLGFEAIARFTHVLENVLARLRSGTLPVSRPVVSTLLSVTDVLRGLLQRARENDDQAVDGLREAIAALEDLAGADGGRSGRATPPRPRETKEAPGTLYEIWFHPPLDLLRRGLDPVRIIETLGELGTLERVEPDLATLPPLGEMDPESAYLGFTCWLTSAEPLGRLETCFEFVADDAAVRIEAREQPMPPPRPATSGDAPTEAVRPAAPLPGGALDESPAVAAGPEATTIRVPTGKIDRLVDLVGELAIAQSMVAQLVAGFTPDRLDRLVEAVTLMDRHARDLQERVMAVRMLPIRTVFGRFPRLVRDVALSRGKQMLLETEGHETELDKSVIEQISDPLTHLVRNAVDHGIETPEARRRSGKPEVGRLTLRAYQQSGSIYIEVADDGAGLDRDRILAKAREAGLVQETDGLTDEQVYAFIFRPGFSTAERVTEVSGRGVGMDVVKRNLEALGGSIQIQTERGRGTTFRVKLPLTLAILEGQALRVGDETYILPLVSIVETIQPKAETLIRVFGASEAITVRGRVLPVLHLNRLFGKPDRDADPDGGLAVIVEHGDAKVALRVDELLEQQRVVIKSLEENFRKLDGIAGATILGDGRVALILDVPGLVAMGHLKSRPFRSRGPAAPPEEARQLVAAGG
jgi:two-component system, chemotaxis family, sensor kinase CheA